MAIPEGQLETWSHQGSITQSSTTYATVRSALERAGSLYAGKKYEIHLQGSYCNATNIFSESDVDVVIRIDDSFYHDLTRLSEPEKVAFNAVHSDSSYPLSKFKADVLAQLTREFGVDVTPGDKAIAIAGRGARRPADVIVAAQFRRYRKFRTLSEQDFALGMCFFNAAGQRIENYPKQHSANCTKKHQQTAEWFKPTVRIFKNMRSKLRADGLIDEGLAPSYFIEGMLYNVPNSEFGRSYQSTVVNALNWLLSANRDELLCANEQYYLLRGDKNVTWSPESFTTFVGAVVDLWQAW